jgi:hypothetical protein
MTRAEVVTVCNDCLASTSGACWRHPKVVVNWTTFDSLNPPPWIDITFPGGQTVRYYR